MSKGVGGAELESLMPNLEVLALDNDTFTNNGDLTGVTQVTGTGWTAAGIMAQTSGMPLKVALGGNVYGKDGVFAPGVHSLGEVLSGMGYVNYFRMGSEAEFAGRDTYLETHGDYTIHDYNSSLDTREIPEGYQVWWGYEDVKLFDFAIQDLEQIALNDEPFNYTLLTADTHFADGYICELCGTDDDRQYANVIKCQDEQIMRFIEWVQDQPFYENTTIIISGDHLSMDTNYFETITGEINRTTFFTIINSVVESEFERERTFTSMDIYPTTLASLGITVEGERIGIGTNLYSDRPTLIEELGYTEFDDGLKGYSSFYNTEILHMQ